MIFVTAELVEEIRVCDKLFRKAKKTNLANNWLTAKRKRTEVCKANNAARRDFIIHQIDSFHEDSEKFWQTIYKHFLATNTAEIMLVYKRGTTEELFLGVMLLTKLITSFVVYVLSFLPNLVHLQL